MGKEIIDTNISKLAFLKEISNMIKYIILCLNIHFKFLINLNIFMD